MATWRYGDMEMETVETWRQWKHGDIDIETWKHGEMETWRHGGMDTQTWKSDILHTQKSNRNWKTNAEAIFLNPYMVCSSCQPKFGICPFVDEETHGSYQFANGLKQTKGTCPSTQIYINLHGLKNCYNC